LHLAQSLLFRKCSQIHSKGSPLQYTIESRPLTSEYSHQPSVDSEPSSTTVEARTAGEALSHFARTNASEIVSFHPMEGRESIATVKKNDSVFLVRVYTN